MLVHTLKEPARAHVHTLANRTSDQSADTCAVMEITVSSLGGDVRFTAGEWFVSHSLELQYTLALFGGNTVYVDDSVGLLCPGCHRR